MRRVNLTIGQSYRANNLINRMKQRTGLVVAVVCLTSGLASTGFCLNQPVSSQSAIAPAANLAWSNTGQLNAARYSHTATLLPNGNVLVTGGYSRKESGTVVLNSAEGYDANTGTWSITGSLITARYWHTASLLQNGKVLVAAGSDEGDLFTALASAELYDPDTGTWSKTASLSDPRVLHSATLLQNGKVLVAGGYGGYVYGQSDSEELYDSATGEWSHTGNVNTIRYGHTSTLLPNRN